MTRLILSVLAPALLTACSVVGIRSGYEQPDYTVVERLGEDVEVRRYEPRLAAEAVVEADDRETGRETAFRALFDYISGANRAESEIAMTTPVATDGGSREIAMTTPVETDAGGDGQLAMRFFLPASYTPESAPEPTDPRVQIVELPAQTMAVLRFSGFWGEDDVAARERELLETLDGRAWHPAGDPVTMFYDPPWTIPFLRRNEVAVPVTQG